MHDEDEKEEHEELKDERKDGVTLHEEIELGDYYIQESLWEHCK